MPGPPWPPESGNWAYYALHCHCGAIRYKMKISPPLLASQNPSPSSDPVYVAKNCQCSHCMRNGVIAIHPKAVNVEFTQGLVRSLVFVLAGSNSTGTVDADDLYRNTE